MNNKKILNKHAKREIVNQNLTLCKYGIYSKLPSKKPLKFNYSSKFPLMPSTNISESYVTPIHSLLLAREFIKNGSNPVIATFVTRDFDATNIESSANMYDEIINLRSNFSKVITRDLFPLQENEVAYIQSIHIIRNESKDFDCITKASDIYTCSLIIASPIDSVIYDINNDDKDNKDNYTIKEYIEMREILEAVFQSAVSNDHDVLILSDFGYKQKPIKDIIDIYNILIAKYCHYFKYIVISLPNMYDNTDLAVFTLFEKEIISLQKL